MYRGALFVLSVLFSIAPAFCQKISIRENGIILTEYQRSDIQTAVRNMYDFFDPIFDCKDVEINVLIFGDDQQFFNYQQEKLSRIISESGYYATATKSIVVNSRGMYVAVIIHEACHGILLQSFPSAPPWVFEGMAEYYENGTARGSKFLIGRNKELFNKLREWRAKEMIDLSEFLRWPDDKWTFFDRGGWFSRYVSYGLVYFLMEKHPAVMTEILGRLKAGRNSYDAVDTSYPGGIQAIEAAFSDYIK